MLMFVEALFLIIKNGNNPNSYQLVKEKYVVPPYNRVIFSNKKSANY